jgi:tetratricopeptide (TPR) repeat protein
MPNPLPLVNKALALYQWKQDLPAASALCREALAFDDECDAAVATLAQLSLQQGRIEEAIEMFGKHAAIARTEPELVQALSYENVSIFGVNSPKGVGETSTHDISIPRPRKRSSSSRRTTQTWQDSCRRWRQGCSRRFNDTSRRWGGQLK